MTHATNRRRRSISKDLTIGLILVVLVVSSIAMFTATIISKEKAEAELNAKADEYIAFIKNTLILPIWNYDFDTIEAVCQTYLQNDLIAHIQVTDHRGKINLNLQKEGIRALAVRSAVLSHLEMPIAKVNIALAPGYLSTLNRQTFWSFCLTILVNLVVLLVMTGFLLRLSLKRPLDRLNLIVDAYAAGTPPSFSQDIPHIEFNALVNTLDAMGRKIQHQVESIRKAERKYRGIFENAIEGIYQSTPSGRILSANPAYARILGYPSPDKLVDTITNIGQQHWVDADHRNLFVKMIKDRKILTNFETRLRRTDGRVIWASINALPVHDRHGKLLHFEGMVKDIDHRKKTEAQLQRLSTAVEQVADNILITNDRGRISYVNPAFEKSIGHSAAELIDQRPATFAADALMAQTHEEIFATVSAGTVWTGRLTNKRKDGESFIVDTIVSPIKSRSGRFLGYVSVNRDVTDKVRFENQLRQAQKMEAIGTLAGGIAHDFNNILGVIIGCSELAMDNLPDNHISRIDLDKVLDAGLRAKSLVSQILTFSRQADSVQQPLVLQPFVKEIIKFLEATLPSTVEIDANIDIADKAILADPTEIQQILMNLCTNAAHAMMPEGGKITIRLTAEEIDAPTAARIADVNQGSYLKLVVADSGQGISENIIDRIFDPFFTTKQVDEGTGLGLSVVHGIVRKYAGSISVQSRPGQGTEFQILLPRLDHPGFSVVSEVSAEPPGGNERILIVENEAIFADILARILAGLGYAVKTFVNSQKAVDFLRSDDQEFDLILADQHMRQLTGLELATMARDIQPTIPVILYSGMIDAHLAEGARQAGVARLLAKPLNRVELAFEIRKGIDDSD